MKALKPRTTSTVSNKKKRVDISKPESIATVLHEAMALAREAGFRRTYQYMVVTSVSELATNILKYAKKGTITLSLLEKGGRTGIEVVARDKGPGIIDIEIAVQDNFSTSGSLGLGLSGVKRMMDEVSIDSNAGSGTVIKARKWVQGK